MFRTVVILAVCSACGGAPLATFRATTEYVATPGPAPTIVLVVGELPSGRLRSVGLVEVTTTSKDRAIAAARSKGAELGCRYLVEHELFVARAAFAFGARVYLTHGGGAHVESHAPRRTTLTFDCAFDAGDPRSTMVMR